MPARMTVKKRKTPWCPLSDGAFVIVRSRPVKLGQLVDLTAESVAFRYLVDGEKVAAGPQQVDIMLSERDVYLRELPVTTVAEREEEPLSFTSTATRIVAMKFGALTEDQRSQLDELLAMEEDC